VDVLEERCAILADAWHWWSATLSELDDASWHRDTRLPGWDVAALSAHASLLVQGLGILTAQPVPSEPTVRTARDMLRSFNAPGGLATTLAATLAALARQQAAATPVDGLVAIFAVNGPHVIGTIAASGPTVVEYFGNGTIPIVEAMSIAILEAVVHGLDLCAAIGAGPDSIPPAALRHTVDLLASMAEPVSFVEAATGRVTTPVLPVLR
jgi:uncharacterized protein (TIGR03083 family)